VENTRTLFTRRLQKNWLLGREKQLLGMKLVVYKYKLAEIFNVIILFWAGRIEHSGYIAGNFKCSYRKGVLPACQPVSLFLKKKL
jgi:hypothetical protein